MPQNVDLESINIDQRILTIRRRRRLKLKLLPFLVGGAVALVLFLSAHLAWQLSKAVLHVPDVDLPTLAQAKTGVSLYDRHNKFVCTVYSERDKDPVSLSKISPYMRDAVVAAEDHNFYRHHGLDFVSIGRAAIVNYKNHRTVQGASTITQQLARNLFLDKTDRSFIRKVREAIMSCELEKKYSKQKILESYLNEVYFGGGVHGVERAAQHYFNKHASQLSIAESAYLAGLIRCPTELSLGANRQLAMRRRDLIISRMATYRLITRFQAQQARQEVLVFRNGPHRLRYPHYVSYVMEELRKQIGDEEWKRGYKVYTNLSPQLQQLAEQELNNGIKNAPKGIDQGALVTISLKDAAILAMVGGVGEYDKNGWNRAIHAHTAGSSFKPFVYLTGLLKGVLKPDTIVDDAPIAIDIPGSSEYAPKNFDGCFKGWLTCRDALAQSRNVCSVRVAAATGVENIAETAHAAGIQAQLDPYLSLALGSCAVTPLELANAYATLARYGLYSPVSTIRRIETGDGQVVKIVHPTLSRNLPQEQVTQLVDIMQDVVKRGTGTQAKLPGIAVAGKTGTADKGKDLWFVGFTPDTVTAVWGGSDKNRPVQGTHVTGGAVMAHIWKQFMTGFYRYNKPTAIAFAAPKVPLIGGIAGYNGNVMVASKDGAGKGFMMRHRGSGLATVNELQQALAFQHMQEIARLQREQQEQAQEQGGDQVSVVYTTIDYTN